MPRAYAASARPPASVASERRPRDDGPAVTRQRERRRSQQPSATRCRCRATSRRLSSSRQHVAEPVRRGRRAAARASASVLGVERPTRPAPQHRAQLVLDVEASRRDRRRTSRPVGRRRQEVPALAVGVVDHGVEDGHPAQVRGRRRGRARRPRRRDRGRRGPRASRRGHGSARHDVDEPPPGQVAAVRRIDPQPAPCPARTGPSRQHGRRDEVPAERPRRPRTPRPRGRPACRRGSPTAAARRAIGL